MSNLVNLKNYLIGGVAAIIVLIVVWQYGISQYKEGYNQAQSEYTNAANVALVANRTEEQRRITEQQKEIDNAKKEINRVRADALAANDTTKRLRKQIDSIRASTTSDDTSITVGSTASTNIHVLADLFEKSDARAGELAQIADESRIRGLACEASYDALINTD